MPLASILLRLLRSEMFRSPSLLRKILDLA